MGTEAYSMTDLKIAGALAATLAAIGWMLLRAMLDAAWASGFRAGVASGKWPAWWE